VLQFEMMKNWINFFRISQSHLQELFHISIKFF
jgi:hypothetical protein